jgi:hypothetical protein
MMGRLKMGKVENRKIGDRIHYFDEKKKEVLVHMRKKNIGLFNSLKCGSVDFSIPYKFDPFLWAWFWKYVTCEKCLAKKGI